MALCSFHGYDVLPLQEGASLAWDDQGAVLPFGQAPQGLDDSQVQGAERSLTAIPGQSALLRGLHVRGYH